MTVAASLPRLLHRTVVALSLALMAASWIAMTSAARRAMFFEPTSAALARAAQDRPAGILSGCVYVAASVALSVSARRPRLLLLAGPGLLTAATLALAPQAAAFVVSLLTTAVTLLIAACVAVEHAFRRRHLRPDGGRRPTS